jgi:thymidylate kinase
MANLIILEGLSRTGKSTITKTLSERYGFRNISLKDKMPECVERLTDFYHGIHMISNEFFRSFENETFILDRSFLSEMVYSKHFNRPTNITEDMVIADLLHDNNFVLINLTNTHKSYMNRSPKDRFIYSYDDFNNQKDLFFWFYEHFKSRYHTEKWQNRFIEIDTDENTLSKVIDKIEYHITKNNIITKIYEKNSDCNG